MQGQKARHPLSEPVERAGLAAGGQDAAAAGGGTSRDASLAEAAVAEAAAAPTSMEAFEERLAAMRQRRAALETLYDAQLDAEVQRLLAESTAQECQQSPGTSARSQGAASTGQLSPSVPTSEASAGSGSSSQVSQATSGSSVDVSAELENLLAEAEAEVQRELAAARVLRGSGLYPHSSARTPPFQLQYPSLQSSVGRGRGRSTTGSVAQGSHTVSTGIAGQTGAMQAVSVVAPTVTAASGGKLKPVLEEPASEALRPTSAADADAAQGAGPKPADSSSSSSSSPDKGEGGQSKSAKAAGQDAHALAPEVSGSDRS